MMGKLTVHCGNPFNRSCRTHKSFASIMNNYNWCDGLSDDVLKTVVAMFAKGEDVPLSEREVTQTLTTKPGRSIHKI